MRKQSIGKVSKKQKERRRLTLEREKDKPGPSRLISTLEASEESCGSLQSLTSIQSHYEQVEEGPRQTLNPKTIVDGSLDKLMTILEENDIDTEVKSQIIDSLKGFVDLCEDQIRREQNARRILENERDMLGRQNKNIAHTQTQTDKEESVKIKHQHSQTEGEITPEKRQRAYSEKLDHSTLIEELNNSCFSTILPGMYKKKTIPPSLYSLMVTHSDKTKTAEEVFEEVRLSLNAKAGDIEIERVRRARQSRVIISCKTEEARAKVSEKLKRATKAFDISNIPNKNPLIILKDVSKHNSDEDVLVAIKNQNHNIFEGTNKLEQDIKIMYKKKARNIKTHHIVIRVSPKVWLRITEQEAVHIDVQTVRAMDQSPLVQCSLCLGYGHGRRLCTQTVERCGHCGGTHKIGKDCSDWVAREAPTCINCVRAKIGKCDHNAFDAVCTVRRRWDALARSTVNYG